VRVRPLVWPALAVGGGNARARAQRPTMRDAAHAAAGAGVLKARGGGRGGGVRVLALRRVHAVDLSSAALAMLAIRRPL